MKLSISYLSCRMDMAGEDMRQVLVLLEAVVRAELSWCWVLGVGPL